MENNSLSQYRTAEHQESKDRKILAWDDDVLERFWDKYLSPDVNGCETWRGNPHHGYGEFWANGQHFQAHRAAAVLRLGTADYAYQEATMHDAELKQAGLCIGKLCGAHVKLGSQTENNQSPDRAKLDWPQVKAIRERCALGGVTQQELAEEYGVDPSHIYYIVNYKTWKQPEVRNATK